MHVEADVLALQYSYLPREQRLEKKLEWCNLWRLHTYTLHILCHNPNLEVGHLTRREIIIMGGSMYVVCHNF